MKIQEQIDSTDLDMTEAQVKAFFLGILCAEKPLNFSKALSEILSETPEAKSALETPLKTLWDELNRNLKSELINMFPHEKDVTHFLQTSKDQLDFFLTGMSLSGTHSESCKDEELGEFINELEDMVEDVEDYLGDDEADEEDGQDIKEFLLDSWKEFASTK
jgi:uncharacterized protein YgfB (UPF0149 family)